MFERVENELAILERHLQVLDAVADHEPVGLVTLTNRLSYPQHKVRYSLRVLEADDLVESTAAGAVTTDKITDFRATATERLTQVAHTVEQLQTDLQLPIATVTDSATAD